jgi:hypothetical protein
MLCDFNVPVYEYDWLTGTQLSNFYYYNVIEGNLVHATSCFLGFNEHNNYLTNDALLDRAFTNIKDLFISI